MKILASDFDNTIYYLDNEKQNKRNIASINKFINEGNIFIIITGRNYTDLKELLEKNNIPYNYLVCEDGAKIFDSNDNCIKTKNLSKETINQVNDILNKLNCDYYLDDGYKKTDNLDDVVKVVVNCTSEKEKERIVESVKEKIDIHIYASRFHVNIINKVVNKKYGLHQLFELEELDMKSLHVIGDNDNDFEMLKEFNGAVIKKHHPILNSLNKDEYETIEDYIEELMKN